MPDPKVLDFSAPDEDVVTIKFPGPGNHSCELPTMDEMTMPVFQFVAANGDEWYRLFDKPDQTEKQRARFEHLNNQLAYALCQEVPRKVVDRLKPRQKAKMIVGFMTASPQLLEMAREAMEEVAKGRKKQSGKRRTTAR